MRGAPSQPTDHQSGRRRRKPKTIFDYVSSKKITVYAIVEVFIDATNYLHTYGMTAHELTMMMVRDVLYNTGITAMVGIV